MSDYYWLEFYGRPLIERYPDWVEGVHLWRDAIGSDARTRPGLLDALVSHRASVSWGTAGTELSRPRLFISHRQDDERRARDVADLAQTEGFQVWLDVLDSALQTTARAPTGAPADALAIALIIEMALLNCSHVIALITPRTPGTYWVPYEYGRVKDSSPHSLRAACWIDRLVSYEPEYLDLGVKTRTDDDIRYWLRREMAEWDRMFVRSAADTGTSSTGANSPPPGEREAIAKPFREGVGTNIQAPPPAVFGARTRNASAEQDPMLLETTRDIEVSRLRLKKGSDP